MKKRNTIKTILFSAFLLLLPFAVFASHGTINLNLDYPVFGGFDLKTDQHINELIGFLYYFMVGIAGLAAFVMLVWGGVQWLLSGAIPAQASEARDKIRNAILGLLLILASFLVVQILNPELSILDNPVITGGTGSNSQLSTNGSSGSGGTTGSTFTINGGTNPVTIAPGDPVDLAWSIQNALDCDATSNPPNSQWDATDIPTNGNQQITNLTTGGWHEFTISCRFQSGNPSPTYFVSAFVDTGGGGPITNPTITITGAWRQLFDPHDPTTEGRKLLRFDDPEHVNDDTLLITVAWVTQNADSCTGSGALDMSRAKNPGPGNTSGYIQQIPPGATVRYTLTCTNTSGGAATDEVIYEAS